MLDAEIGFGNCRWHGKILKLLQVLTWSIYKSKSDYRPADFTSFSAQMSIASEQTYALPTGSFLWLQSIKVPREITSSRNQGEWEPWLISTQFEILSDLLPTELLDLKKRLKETWHFFLNLKSQFLCWNKTNRAEKKWLTKLRNFKCLT